MTVIPSDRVIGYAPAGTTMTFSNDTYLVPRARMQEILHELGAKAEQGTK